MATEKRLIDVSDLGSFSFHIECEEEGEIFERCVVDWEDIETAPTVNAVEVVHGRWNPNNNCGYRCSICDFWVAFRSLNNYFPNCGAKMDGGADNGL